MRTNIAKRIIDYYGSEDFQEEYKQLLFEEFCQNKDEIIDKIIHIVLNEQNIKCSKLLASSIYDEILQDFDTYIDTFQNYYVGYCCLGAVSFGEQEEQLSGIGMNLKYLRHIFNKEGFYVSKDNYAYYDMSGSGLMVELKFTPFIMHLLGIADNQ